jgi:F-type H+-transporting ATPase subunit epsilon
MKLQFLSPSKTIFNGDVESVTIPGSKGSFTVLENHAALLTTVSQGNVIFQIKGAEIKEYTVSGGFAEVQNNVVSICIEKIIDSEKKE